MSKETAPLRSDVNVCSSASPLERLQVNDICTENATSLAVRGLNAQELLL